MLCTNLTKKRKKVAVEDAVNWDRYFKHIKCVCPWSYSAWTNNKIKIARWQKTIMPLTYYKAIVYLTPNHSRRQLKRVTGLLNDRYSQYTFLWSEPTYGMYASPVSCIIQQDYKELEEIRQNAKKINR